MNLKHRYIKKWIIIITAIFTFSLAVIISRRIQNSSTDGSEVRRDSENALNVEYQSFEELNGRNVSMLTGAPFEELVLSKAPEVESFSFFNSTPDMILALKAGKTDAFLSNNAVGTLAVNRNTGIALFPQSLNDGVFGFAFAKGSTERARWQAAYDTISEETKQELWEKWTGSDESIKILPVQDWPGSNGTVEAAVCDTLEPMSYAGEDGELIGFDIEMLLLIAEKLDVHINFTGMEFSAIMASVQSGKALVGAGSIIATDERKQSVDFVEYYPAAFVLVVRTLEAEEPEITLADIHDPTVAIMTGSSFQQSVESHFPDAQYQYYNTVADELNALKTEKVDAIALDIPVARNIQAEDRSVVMVPEKLDSLDFGFVIAKSERGETICDELSKYICLLKSDGTLEELQNKWFDSSDLSSVDMTDYRNLPDDSGVIKLAIVQYPPFTMNNGEMYCGYEIEIVAMFCRDHGYALEIADVNSDALLATVQSGKCDIGCCSIAITEERKESMLFTEPDYSGGTVLLVRRGSYASESNIGFFSSLKDSFHKTFIRENRWMLFVQGIGTTFFITLMSIIFGTALGFSMYMFCRDGDPVAGAITRLCVWLVQGMPVVVLLMIIYYIIFGKTSISGVFVSIIGFTFVFSTGVYGMLRNGIAAVDNGQTEAAYALGYTDSKAFFRIILPQALPYIIPVYKGEITALIKATAVVGYVAVQDLTKMGDIVRSRTYEAFFPLIAVAIVYFILAFILTSIVKRIEIRINPRSRSKEDILKGVKMR